MKFSLKPLNKRAKLSRGVASFSEEDKKLHQILEKVRDSQQVETYDIFLSHASEDDKIVDDLDKELQKFNLKAFIDHKDTKGKPDYDRIIQCAMASSKYGLLFISTSYVEKYYVGSMRIYTEFGFFYNRKKKFLPVFFGVDRDKIGSYLPYTENLFNIEVGKRDLYEVAQEIANEIKNRE